MIQPQQCLYITMSSVYILHFQLLSWAGGISFFPMNIIFDWKKRSHSTRLKIRRPGVEQVFFIHDGGGWDCGSHKYKALRIQVWPKKGIGIIVGPRDVLTINPTLGKGRRIRKALRTKTKQKTQPVHIKGIYFIRVNHGSS